MIKLVKSTFYKEEETKKKLITFIQNAKILSSGQECERFEKNFAKWQGRKYCIYVNSGSSANLAIIQALLNLGKLKRGDFVGFSALTWSTNVMPLLQLGLQAIPIDVELETLNVSSKQLKKRLEKYPLKMLFLTNLLGFCHDIDSIREICFKKNTLFVEDNCESLGTIYKGKKLGNFGAAATFSFYVGHHLSTIEGGAICTDDEEIANMLKIVRAHGWDRSLSFAGQNQIRKQFKINSTFYSRYTFYDLGFNLRNTEINGYIGNVQLSYIDEIIEKRRRNFLAIATPIYKNRNYFPIKFNHVDFLSNFAVPIICKSKTIRDALIRKCRNRIEVRPIVGGNIAKQPFFVKHMKKFSQIHCPNTELVHDRGFYVGNNPDLTKKEQEEIIHAFTDN